MQQIKRFERKNRKAKQRINQQMLLQMGNQVISQVPGDRNEERDEMEELKQQFKQVIQGKNKIGDHSEMGSESSAEFSDEEII